MSKLQLKKILAEMEKDELIGLILDHYAQRKDAKEYLDFYSEPDEEKLLERYRQKISKELAKSKYRRSKAKVTNIKNAVKDFESFGVDAQSSIDLMLFSLQTMLRYEKVFDFPDPLVRCCDWLVERCMTTAHADGQLDVVLKSIKAITSNESIGHGYFRSHINHVVDGVLNDFSKQL